MRVLSGSLFALGLILLFALWTAFFDKMLPEHPHHFIAVTCLVMSCFAGSAVAKYISKD